MKWDEMEWNGMGTNGKKWNMMEHDRIGWDGTERDGIRLEWDRMGWDGISHCATFQPPQHPRAPFKPSTRKKCLHLPVTSGFIPVQYPPTFPKLFLSGKQIPGSFLLGEWGWGLPGGWVGLGFWELTPPWGCASLPLAGNSLLTFPGTPARFHSSCLVFLANSCRVKLFNNIFSGLQAAGETEPRRCARLCRCATWGQPQGKVSPETLRNSEFWSCKGRSWALQLPAGIGTRRVATASPPKQAWREVVGAAPSPSRNKGGVFSNQLREMGSRKRILGTSSFAL